mgnify:CR=1 FL=1
MKNRTQLDAVTSGGTTGFNAFNTGTGTLVGLFCPALSSGTFTFEAKDKAGTWYPVRDIESASAYYIPVGSAGFVPVDANVFAGVANLRITGNTNELSSKSVYPVVAPIYL